MYVYIYLYSNVLVDEFFNITFFSEAFHFLFQQSLKACCWHKKDSSHQQHPQFLKCKGYVFGSSMLHVSSTILIFNPDLKPIVPQTTYNPVTLPRILSVVTRLCRLKCPMMLHSLWHALAISRHNLILNAFASSSLFAILLSFFPHHYFIFDFALDLTNDFGLLNSRFVFFNFLSFYFKICIYVFVICVFYRNIPNFFSNWSIFIVRGV